VLQRGEMDFTLGGRNVILSSSMYAATSGGVTRSSGSCRTPHQATKRSTAPDSELHAKCHFHADSAGSRRFTVSGYCPGHLERSRGMAASHKIQLIERDRTRRGGVSETRALDLPE
jgi:hypothetical protein